MFHFTKKNLILEEQILEEVSDEQLSQVTGGGLLSTVDVGSVLGTVDGTVGQLLNTTNVGGFGVQVAGISIGTPAISSRNLL